MKIYDLTKEKNKPLWKRKATKKLLKDWMAETKASIGILGMARIRTCEEKLHDNS